MKNVITTLQWTNVIRLPEIKTAELSTYGNLAKCHQAHFRVSRVGLGMRLVILLLTFPPPPSSLSSFQHTHIAQEASSALSDPKPTQADTHDGQALGDDPGSGEQCWETGQRHLHAATDKEGATRVLPDYQETC